MPRDGRPHDSGTPHLWSHQYVQPISFLLIPHLHKVEIHYVAEGNLVEHDVVEDRLLAGSHIPLLHLLVQQTHLHIEYFQNRICTQRFLNQIFWCSSNSYCNISRSPQVLSTFFFSIRLLNQAGWLHLAFITSSCSLPIRSMFSSLMSSARYLLYLSTSPSVISLCSAATFCSFSSCVSGDVGLLALGMWENEESSTRPAACRLFKLTLRLGADAGARLYGHLWPVTFLGVRLRWQDL